MANQVWHQIPEIVSLVCASLLDPDSPRRPLHRKCLTARSLADLLSVHRVCEIWRMEASKFLFYAARIRNTEELQDLDHQFQHAHVRTALRILSVRVPPPSDRSNIWEGLPSSRHGPFASLRQLELRSSFSVILPFLTRSELIHLHTLHIAIVGDHGQRERRKVLAALTHPKFAQLKSLSLEDLEINSRVIPDSKLAFRLSTLRMDTCTFDDEGWRWLIDNQSHPLKRLAIIGSILTPERIAHLSDQYASQLTHLYLVPYGGILSKEQWDYFLTQLTSLRNLGICDYCITFPEALCAIPQDTVPKLREVVSKNLLALRSLHISATKGFSPWSIDDNGPDFFDAQLRSIKALQPSVELREDDSIVDVIIADE